MGTKICRIHISRGLRRGSIPHFRTQSMFSQITQYLRWGFRLCILLTQEYLHGLCRPMCMLMIVQLAAHILQQLCNLSLVSQATSSYVSPCVLNLVPNDTDIVLLEFTFNDSERSEQKFDDPTR